MPVLRCALGVFNPAFLLRLRGRRAPNLPAGSYGHHIVKFYLRLHKNKRSTPDEYSQDV
jgi:hypothetical protein